MDQGARRRSAAFYASEDWRRLRAAALARDGWRCTAAGCQDAAQVVDHIRRRAHLSMVTEADCLPNLRSLCARHDAQVKELANGMRRNGGRTRIIGADASGWPLDPARR